MDNPPLCGRYLVVGRSLDMSCIFPFETGLYRLDIMADLDINPLSMGPIFRAWIGPTIRI